jgi:hypothetical protein
MSGLPVLLAEILEESGVRDVPEWWERLDQATREQIIQLWEDCAAEYQGQRVAAGVEGYREEEPSDVGYFWHREFYDFLVNHELRFPEEPKFHVCTRHPLAEAAVRNGVIPAGFRCAVPEADCPMERLLKRVPGSSVRLGLGFRAVE